MIEHLCFFYKNAYLKMKTVFSPFICGIKKREMINHDMLLVEKRSH